MADSVDYDPFAPDPLRDPFPAYAELRESCPIHRFDEYAHPLWTVTRYDDVTTLLTNVDLWSSHYGQMPRYSVQGCLFSDPPSHTWYRKLVQKSFAPRHVAAMEDGIAGLVTELLDEMERDHRGDLHDALACPLPVLVIAHILGVPTDDTQRPERLGWGADAWATAEEAFYNLSMPREIITVKELPKLGTGKINHRELAKVIK